MLQKIIIAEPPFMRFNEDELSSPLGALDEEKKDNVWLNLSSGGEHIFTRSEEEKACPAKPISEFVKG